MYIMRRHSTFAFVIVVIIFNKKVESCYRNQRWTDRENHFCLSTCWQRSSASYHLPFCSYQVFLTLAVIISVANCEIININVQSVMGPDHYRSVQDPIGDLQSRLMDFFTKSMAAQNCPVHQSSTLLPIQFPWLPHLSVFLRSTMS